jgi:hypothetical protein
VGRIGDEKRTYNPGTDATGANFLRDVTRRFTTGDPEANERLNSHMREERVERGKYLERTSTGSTTANFAGLTVPQYLTDLYAPSVAALRPFADQCTQHPLPAAGMSLNISRMTTGSTVEDQAAELDDVSWTDEDDSLLTIPVRTAAGQQLLSRQAIDRGTGLDDVTMNDLFRKFATNLDGALLNTSGVGLTNVAAATAFASGDGAALYPKILGAASAAETATAGQATADLVVMHVRRWYWLSSQMTATWPLVGQPGIPPLLGGQANGQPYGGIRGILPNGMRVVADNNVLVNGGTAGNQDEVYVVPSAECHLWEDPQAPVFIRADQPQAGKLGVNLVLFGYYAFTFGRYANAMGKISGAGLATPSF